MKYGELEQFSIAEISQQPNQILRELTLEAEAAIQRAKLKKASIDAALSLKFSEKAKVLRDLTGKETGVVNFEDDGLPIVADQPKKIEWDQDQLASIAHNIRQANLDPTEFMDITYKVPERKFNGWSHALQQTYAPARTVKLGKPTFKFGEVK
ncbi:hypothetical protein [Teredinibacter sp. KSP-S5-2]|uniref:hypothetical protein n=1 Tax=Teredinibacter sp. KSP-S5-2 TaxID=3034506 RepID=UPI002934BF50|nr:hypothetical protein [Teredinibacter sp. KSP-S5-2]WNO10515.1 hypothetical protein P5V12_04950 [Teredinibacter sp. KSP-S5-2]